MVGFIHSLLTVALPALAIGTAFVDQSDLSLSFPNVNFALPTPASADTARKFLSQCELSISLLVLPPSHIMTN
jgi:hypothetical protein